MQYSGRSKEIATRILDQFKSGNVAQPMATIMLGSTNKPMGKWSVSNKFICYLSGCTDARGIKQWRTVGRSVAGHSATTYILAPVFGKYTKKDEATGEDMVVEYIRKLTSVPVWDVDDTSGEPLELPEDHQATLDALPLLKLAEAWGLSVGTEDAHGQGWLGFYDPKNGRIRTGVKNLIVYLHEWVHAADYKNGTKVEPPNHPVSEAVAQFGASILAHMLGLGDQADEGLTWKYILHQAGGSEDEAIALCLKILKRTSDVVNLIIESARALETPELAAA